MEARRRLDTALTVIPWPEDVKRTLSRRYDGATEDIIYHRRFQLQAYERFSDETEFTFSDASHDRIITVSRKWGTIVEIEKHVAWRYSIHWKFAHRSGIFLSAVVHSDVLLYRQRSNRQWTFCTSHDLRTAARNFKTRRRLMRAFLQSVIPVELVLLVYNFI